MPSEQVCRRRAKTGTGEQPVMMARAADLADCRPGTVVRRNRACRGRKGSISAAAVPEEPPPLLRSAAVISRRDAPTTPLAYSRAVGTQLADAYLVLHSPTHAGSGPGSAGVQSLLSRIG